MIGVPGEPGKTETGERLDRAVGRLRPFCRELYNQHLRKLTVLTDDLLEDIEKGNLEPRRRPAKTNPKAVFGGLDLVRVYPAQNKRLWPFLSQHLDNEFINPLLTAQINQVAIATQLAHVLKIESKEKDLVDTVREKLDFVSESGMFAGRCKICQRYFVH